MLKIRHVILVLGVLMSPLVSSAAQVSIGIGLPHVSIGINLPAYPQLVVVPGYPVYYAPRLAANYFFYDGLYWVEHDRLHLGLLSLPISYFYKYIAFLCLARSKTKCNIFQEKMLHGKKVQAVES